MWIRDTLNILLIDAVERKASDIHLTVGAPPILRINGVMTTVSDQQLTNEDTSSIAKLLLRDADWEKFNQSGDIDTSYQLGDTSRFRVNVFKQKHYVTIVARIIPTIIPTIEQLNMPDILKKLTTKKQGLVLVTGPTGSGKSTTLASMIDYINQRESRHIITLEDPIEYLHQHKKSIVNQREVGTDTDGFAKGLRASLRQDPDIILVGEMRDLETVATAITAAETGHLVFATLHTNSAIQTINRIMDVFPANQQGQIRSQLASVIEGIISQRLLPTANGKGRVVATEVLTHSSAVANLIRSDKVDQITNIMQTSRASGMHMIDTSIKELLLEGKISEETSKLYVQETGAY